MNPQEYIESGKLESYVLGSSSQDEMQEVECMARVFPEVHQELESIRASFENYALTYKVEAPSNLKSKLFAAIEQEDSNITSVAPNGQVKVINLQERTGNSISGLKLLVAASMALLIVSAFVVYNLYRDNQELSSTLASLGNDQEKLQFSFNELQNKFENTKKEVLVLINPNSFSITMKGLPLSPQSLATVYWNKQSKEVYLAVNLLPTPPQGKQYQLWAIVNNAPVDLGVFDVSTSGDSLLQKMKTVDNAAAFAVTLENAGGSPSPTLDQMFVHGTI